MVDTREVTAFLAVAEHLHFGHAAQQLHVTPARVSQLIRTLERRVGGPLFERTSRTVALTPLGKQLLEQWRPAYAQLQDALSEARQAAAEPVANRIRVGYPATVAPPILELITDFYAERRPGSRILWAQDRLLDMYDWGPGSDLGLDAVIGWLPPGARPWNSYLRIGPPIRREPPVIVVAVDHPLAGRSSVDVEELVDHPLLQPKRVSDTGLHWVPATTPAGRPLTRVDRPSHHSESLLGDALDDGLAHLTLATLNKTPAWNLVRGGAVLVPVTGLAPFTLRTVWPASAASAGAAADFAELAARAGAARQRPADGEPTGRDGPW